MIGRSPCERLRILIAGRDFASADEVRSFAELIALDMGCSEDAEALGEIQVRDIRGAKLFAVPVQSSASIAA